MTYLKAMAVLLAVCSLSGCGEGKDMSFAQARSYVTRHEGALRALMHKVEDCQPSVIESGHRQGIDLREGTGHLYCADDNSGPGASIASMRDDMRRLGVIALTYEFDGSGAVTKADFWLFRENFGRSLSIVYVKAPGTLDDESPIPYRRIAVTPEGDSWYWQRSVD